MKRAAGILATVGIVTTLATGVTYHMKSNTENQILRVAFPSNLPASAYEPTNINLDYEYIFLENTFSALVETDPQGVIQPGVAEKVDWVGDELRFTLRANLLTASGKLITADDVVFSLKRLLVLSQNSHGNFKDLICPNVKIESINDECPGIRQDGNFVFLKAPKRKSFLMPMLSAIDFAVIPKSSVDPVTLKINNFHETSGPYYVESDDGKGNILLKINPSHYHAKTDVAQSIQLVPTDIKIKGHSLTLLAENKVDHITTVDASKADELLSFAEKNPDISSHSTMKIRHLVVMFGEKGRKNLSLSERRYIGEKLRSAFTKIYQSIPGYEPHDEFFPSLGEGGLSKEQREKLSAQRSDIGSAPKKHFKLGVLKRGPLDPWLGPIQEVLPQAECYIEPNVPDLRKNVKEEDMPDAFVVSTDTGFSEDISLISYSLNAGFLGLTKPERTAWLADYMATDDKEQRMKKLKELHFSALSDVALVPLLASPYTALIRKPWRMELSELYANNQLWLIKHN